MTRAARVSTPSFFSSSLLAGRTALACALVLAACQPQPTEPPEPTTASAEPTGPETIEFEDGFTGTPLRTAELSADATLEVFAEGEGQPASWGKRVSFHFSGYDAATGERVMGTQDWPAKLIVGAEAGEPIGVVMHEVLAGLRPGARVRVKIPAFVANAGRSEHEAKTGELWVTLTVTEVDDPVQPRALEAFAGDPIVSEVKHSGLEIHDYAEGEGLEAVDGDRVEFHYVVTSTEGEPLLSTHEDATPVELTLGASTGVPGLSRGLRGARVGTLRKLVIPAELGFDDYAPEPFPRNTAVVMYIEVTRVDPGPGREI